MSQAQQLEANGTNGLDSDTASQKGTPAAMPFVGGVNSVGDVGDVTQNATANHGEAVAAVADANNVSDTNQSPPHDNHTPLHAPGDFASDEKHGMVREYERKIVAAPNDVPVRLAYAHYLAHDTGDYSAALQQLMHALAIEPNNVLARLEMMRVAEKVDAGSAVQVALATAKIAGDSVEVQHALRDIVLAAVGSMIAGCTATTAVETCAALEAYLVIFNGNPNAPVPKHGGCTLVELASHSGQTSVMERLQGLTTP